MVDELVGTMVGGRYRVGLLLGVGGTASIYEAEDTTFGRRVALKISHENTGPSSLAAKRLVREARASGAVGHPNVCQISEIGALAGTGTPFVVMERLKGETLRDRMTKFGKLPFEDVVDVMMQALSGLGAAHERGILHRDIKPENIFLSLRAGCAALVKILDFGLASTDDRAGEELTAQGAVIGTPYYVAPEHIRGSRDLDPRIDLYACGVVLFEATTGRRPFTASSHAELFREIVIGEAPAVRELRRDTPEELARVITRAMARDPAARYQSAGAFQKALAEVPVGPPTALSLGPFQAGVTYNLADDSGVSTTESDPETTRADRGSARAKSTIPEVVVEFSSSSEWDQATDWDQPTIKQPLAGPKK